MATLENHAAALQDQLIPGLDFRHGNSANYVQSRSNISIYPQGSNSYSASGTRTIRIAVNADANWIDPASVLLYFKVNNKDTTTQSPTAVTRMQPLGGPHVWISRLRILCQGQLVEQIDDYGRLYEMMLRLTPLDYQKQYAAQGFGLQSQNPAGYQDLRQMRNIKPGTGKTVCMPLLCGLLSQSRFLPVQYMNLVFELTISDAADVCAGGTSIVGGVTTTFNSSAYDISDVILKCDSIQLDSALQEEYAKKLLSSTLALSFKSWHHTSYSQSGEQDSVTIAMTRSVSRLCTVFVSFFSVSSVPSSNKEVNYFPHWEGMVDGASDTDHPLATTDVIDDSHGIQYEFVIDGVRTPTTPVLTTVEAYSRLISSLGLSAQTSHSLGVTGRGYAANDCFVICENYEKVLGAAMSGKNLRGGSQLLLNLKNMAPSGIPTTDRITKIFLAVQYDVILELSAAGGVTVLE